MIGIAILAGWLIVWIGFIVIYILLMPFFNRIGAKIQNYFYKSASYKQEIEEDDPKHSEVDKEN